jgi:uncharacterized membrane protein
MDVLYLIFTEVYVRGYVCVHCCVLGEVALVDDVVWLSPLFSLSVWTITSSRSRSRSSTDRCA